MHGFEFRSYNLPSQVGDHSPSLYLEEEVFPGDIPGFLGLKERAGPSERFREATRAHTPHALFPKFTLTGNYKGCHYIPEISDQLLENRTHEHPA